MFKTTIIPRKNAVNIQLPQHFVGREVEITAQVAHQAKPSKQKPAHRKKQDKLDDLTRFYNQYKFDLSNYKFNRDELNER